MPPVLDDDERCLVEGWWVSIRRKATGTSTHPKPVFLREIGPAAPAQYCFEAFAAAAVVVLVEAAAAPVDSVEILHMIQKLILDFLYC